jgi:arylsulfatase A-like enzyme
MGAILEGRPVRDRFSMYQSVRTARWKYLKLGKMELLFDLEEDPGERHDLSRDQPRRLAELQRLAQRLSQGEKQAFDEFVAVVEAGEEVTLDESVKEELRSLGYVQ